MSAPERGPQVDGAAARMGDRSSARALRRHQRESCHQAPELGQFVGREVGEGGAAEAFLGAHGRQHGRLAMLLVVPRGLTRHGERNTAASRGRAGITPMGQRVAGRRVRRRRRFARSPVVGRVDDAVEHLAEDPVEGGEVGLLADQRDPGGPVDAR